jgi:hypothetical protein
MHVEIGNEAAQFLGIHKSDLVCCVRLTEVFAYILASWG